ncbi:MAG: VOC family protein [Opitutus sp.]|nr:VOC family protein [Opitutus sp.]
MNAILGGGGFHHVCVKTRDWERTMRFYRDTLGCTEKIAWRAAPERAVMLDSGDGNYLEIFEDLTYTPAPNGAVVHFALRTTRLEEVAARVRAAGAKITMEPKDVTIATSHGAGPVPIRIFFCEGPSGEVIEFFQNTLT